jgi:uncharacterized protein YyaL (SSP411 family)
MTGPQHTNALAGETSPYLLQHAHNPVQWHPWNQESLAKAKAEDKPILLSIGYSACHWCHVMERESFENEEIAGLMNENFINIKVDREERPDIDSIYMTVVQMMTGRGGWPMTVFLTPDQEPFYCGTYFPPDDLHGMPGFRRVLISIAKAFQEKRQAVESDAKTIAGELRKSDLTPDKKEALDHEALDKALQDVQSNFDSQNGGFGAAPKFPPSMALDCLMRSYRRKKEKHVLDMIELTLFKMATGGVYDQAGGGFHRYSVDAQWLVPHFEKMLYDNALLSRAYLHAYLLTGNHFYRRISEEILDYVAREMTSPEGAFYSSQDADSEGQEGAFFLWTIKEVESILGKDDAELFCRYFRMTPEGNFEGKTILSIPRPAGWIARMNNITEEKLLEIIQRGRKLLFEAREKRVKPGRDEKALTSWNGLMLRSFAEAANSLDRDDYRNIAIRNADFLVSAMYHDGRLFRSYKDGRARFNAYLEDYACLMDGLISTYEATFDLRWIEDAKALAESMASKFWDPQGGGFYFTSDDHEPLIHRPKELYDNATPSGNSTAAYAFLRLSKLTGDDQWMRYSTSILQSTANHMLQHPSAFPNMLCALDFFHSKFKEVAIIGDAGEPETQALLNKVFRAYCPNKVVACGKGGSLFLLKDRPQINGRATAYVCQDFTCGLPITSADDLQAEMERD